jgi:DNA-binding NarL/FixJ family response regulator
MSRKVLVVILRAYPHRYPLVAPPANASEIAFDGAFDAPGLLRVATIHPEVVLLDLRGVSGPISVLIAAVRAACTGARVVVIGTPADGDMAQQALMAGAAGFLTRDLSDNALLTAIANTAQGAMHLTSTGLRVVNKLTELHRPKPKAP